MNKQKIRHINLILTLVVLCVFATLTAQAVEPAYNGKTISEWLAELNTRPSGDEAQWEKWSGGDIFQKKRNRDEDAIRQIGTSGIPTLLSLLSVTDGNGKRVVSKLQSKGLKWEFGGKDAHLEDLRKLAVEGFAILGTNAEPAVPQFTKMLQEQDENIFEVIEALNAIGPKGFAVLTNALNEKDNPARGALIWTIGQRGVGDPKMITQLLIQALKDPDPVTRGNAAQFLAGRNSDLVVPALIPLLDDREYLPRHNAAVALGSFGGAAKSTAPKLLSIYTNSPDVFVLSSLKAIDLETAAKAEQFVANSGPLNAARQSYTRTVLKNGQELIAGGYIHTELPTVTNRYLSSAELITPTAGKWDETGEMTTPRWGHSAVLLHNGKVLVSGGADSKERDSTSTELYDPTIGKWTVTGSLNHTHRAGKAVLQPNGKVRIQGGWDGFKITDDELYDPATGTWSVIPKK